MLQEDPTSSGVEAGILPTQSSEGSKMDKCADRCEKQSTVLFCDLVDSTTYVSRYGAIQQREFFLSYYQAVTTIIKNHDGGVVGYIGDGIQAIFCRRQAPSVAAEAAVLASMRVIEMMNNCGNLRYLRLGPKPRVRISIATDRSLIGASIRTGEARQSVVFGIAPYLAARLNKIGEPDSIIISNRTRKLLGDRFCVRDMGVHKLKGFDEPERCWEVLRQPGC